MIESRINHVGLNVRDPDSFQRLVASVRECSSEVVSGPTSGFLFGLRQR